VCGAAGARASATEQAVGRLLGSLCALTARDGDAQTAMLASWISQARPRRGRHAGRCVARARPPGASAAEAHAGASARSSPLARSVYGCVARMRARLQADAARRLYGLALQRVCACAHAQASFDPPGLTVAVKRDRAAEALLLTGSKFVVNILAEGAEKARPLRADSGRPNVLPCSRPRALRYRRSRRGSGAGCRARYSSLRPGHSVAEDMSGAAAH